MDINMPELRGAADELGIDLDNLLPAIEDAILGAYSKVPGAIRGAHVEIDRRTGHMSVLAPEVDEDDQPTGEYFDDTPDDFGRIAQATARSVIVQRIQDRRDFEVLGAFKDKTGELISGTVEQGRDPRIVYVRLDEEHEGIMPPHEQVPGESYRHGDRVRAYVCALAEGDRPEDLRAGAYDDSVAERRMAFRGLQRRPTQCDAVIEHAVVADLRRFADDHAHAVVDEEPPPDGRPGMDFDPRDRPHRLGDEPGWKPQPGRALPHRVSEAVAPHRVDARVAQNDLEGRPDRRVVFAGGANVFASALDEVRQPKCHR